MTIPQDSRTCIDLHCHSTASDGALSPEALIARAVEQGVSHLALTDHDTIAGLEVARGAASGSGLSLINGVELSCVWRSHTIHVVGLDFDERDPAFLAALERQNECKIRRKYRIQQISSKSNTR